MCMHSPLLTGDSRTMRRPIHAVRHSWLRVAGGRGGAEVRGSRCFRLYVHPVQLGGLRPLLILSRTHLVTYVS